jgi:TRAP-type C4-dicarboxylate transport system substrate-binding protein
LAKHVIRTDHLMASSHITVHDKTFSALPSDQQQLLTACAKEAVQNTRKVAQLDTDETLKKFVNEGATVSTIDKSPIQQKARDAVGRMEKDGTWAPGLWEQIQKL